MKRTLHKGGIYLLAQQKKNLEDQIKARAITMPKDDLEAQQQKNDLLVLQGSLEKINGDIAKNNLEIKRQSIEKQKEENRIREEELIKLSKSMALTQGVIHGGRGSGGQYAGIHGGTYDVNNPKHYDMFHIGKGIGNELSGKTNKQAPGTPIEVQNHQVLVQINETLKSTHIQTRNIAQNNVGGGSGDFHV